MKTRPTLLALVAGSTVACAAAGASAGWYLGAKHDHDFNSRFLQRPCPPYHGWNRPFYGWSSNYRPYYFTPQGYANTPWNYGPNYQDTVYRSAAPTPGLNAFGVPVTAGATTSPIKPANVPQTPTLAPPIATPPAMTPPPAIPKPPKPSL